MRERDRRQSPDRRAEQSASARRGEGAPGRAAAMAAAGRTGGLPPSALVSLQRAAGNAATAAALGQEQHVHDASCGHTVQRSAVQHEVQRSAVHEVLNEPGRPMEPAVRGEMEARTGMDLSAVRIHTGAKAHAAAESVNAHAFTSGRNLVFQRGRYDAHTTSGKKMLLHELKHFDQQSSGPVPGTDVGGGMKVSSPGDSAEREADSFADKALKQPLGETPAPAAPSPAGATGSVQRIAIQRVRGGRPTLPPIAEEDEAGPPPIPQKSPLRQQGNGGRQVRRRGGVGDLRQTAADQQGPPPIPQKSPLRQQGNGGRQLRRRGGVSDLRQTATDQQGPPPIPQKSPLRQQNQQQPPGKDKGKGVASDPVLKAAGKPQSGLDQAGKGAGSTTAPTVGSNFDKPVPLPGGGSKLPSTGASRLGFPLGAALGAAGAAAALPGSVAGFAEARQKIKTANEGTAKHREIRRSLKSAAADVLQHSLNVTRHTTNTVVGGLRFGATANPALSVTGAAVGGGAVTSVAGLYQTGRDTRKAVKANSRVKALTKLVRDENKPMEALQGAVDMAEELRLAHAEVDALRDRLDRLEDPQPGDVPDQAELDQWMQDLEAAENELQRLKDIDKSGQAMERALGTATADVKAYLKAEKGERGKRGEDGKRETPPLWLVQAYAIKKNQRGRIKKVVSAVGNLGTAGSGVAATVLGATAIAGSAALMATPVGWAFAGLAASAAIPLLGYRSWQYYTKRWDELAHGGAGDDLSRGERTKLLLQWWKKVGGSKRDFYAGVLYDLAAGNNPPPPSAAGPSQGGDNEPTEQEIFALRTEEARKTLEALGLSWDMLSREEDPASAKKLIAAKMGS